MDFSSGEPFVTQLHGSGVVYHDCAGLVIEKGIENLLSGLVAQLFGRKRKFGLCGQIQCEVLSRTPSVERLHFALGFFQILGGVNPEDTTARFIFENIEHFEAVFRN